MGKGKRSEMKTDHQGTQSGDSEEKAVVLHPNNAFAPQAGHLNVMMQQEVVKAPGVQRYHKQRVS
jgi:hypothetical protein